MVYMFQAKTVRVVAMACLWRFTFDALAFISSKTQLTPVIFTLPFSFAEGDFLVDFDNLAVITRNKGGAITLYLGRLSA